MVDSAQVSTGSDKFDPDLEAFLATFESDELARIKTAFADHSLSLEALSAQVSPGFIRALITLATPIIFAGLLETASPKFKSRLERGRDLAREHFPNFHEHPAVVARLREDAKSAQKEKEDAKNIITGVSWEPLWAGDPPDLSPTVRIELTGRAEKLLLHSTLELHSVAFLTRALAGILAAQIESTISLAKKKLVKLTYPERIGKYVREAQSCLAQIEQLGPKVGIELPEKVKDDNEKPGPAAPPARAS
ncbi:MAG: hypothetical protein KJ749_05710 [Planctomycetes bacterium]|nr:hypothetical protein [Planctomycetota bacterium]